MEMIFDIETMEQTGDKPIVRCEDCRYSGIEVIETAYGDYIGEQWYCCRVDERFPIYSDCFCSWGKTKDN